MFRFQVNVQFCVDECNPVDCGEGIKSYGRKKRDTQENAITSTLRTTTVSTNILAFSRKRLNF